MVEDRKELLERPLGWKEPLGRSGRNQKKELERTLGEDRKELLGRTLWLERTDGEGREESLERTGKNSWKEPLAGKNHWEGQGGT